MGLFSSDNKVSALLFPSTIKESSSLMLCYEYFTKNPVIFRCITLISTNVAKVVSKYSQLLGDITQELMITGNSYIHNHQLLDIFHLSHHKSTYKYHNQELSHVLHIYLNKTNISQIGMSPILVAQKLIDIHNSMTEFLFFIIKNGGRPSGIFSHQRMETIYKEQNKKQLQRLYDEMGQKGTIALIEGEYKWEPIGLSPTELKLIETRIKIEREICSIFGIPPVLLGIEDATFNNFHEARKYFISETILPLANLVIEKFNTFYDENVTINYSNNEFL